MAPLLVIFLGYLLGAIPTGYLLVRFVSRKAMDVRTMGSGSTGATNVIRAAGRPAGFLTYLLDLGKGYLAVTLASMLTRGDLRWMGAAGVAVILGHVFSFWLGFKGGKGVATGLGVFLAISPLAILSALALWGIIVGVWRYVSLGSVLATATVPGWIWFWDYLVFSRPLTEVMMVEVFAATSCLIVLVKHHENIQRLMTGTESRIGTTGSETGGS